MTSAAPEPTCTVDETFVKPCRTLARAVSHTTGVTTAAGVRHITWHELATMKPTRSMIVLATGDLKPRGVVMNYCPFCGTRISEHMMAARGDGVVHPGGTP